MNNPITVKIESNIATTDEKKNELRKKLVYAFIEQLRRSGMYKVTEEKDGHVWILRADLILPKKHEAVYDKGYKDGLEKAWGIAKKIFTPQRAYEEAYGRDELDIIFGEGITSFELAQMTAFEVVDKVELYEKQKTEKDKIKDGDEVRLDDGTKGVVVFSSTDGHLNVVNAYGGMRSYNATEVVKTGRHFPQMVEMMKEMRDNDETN